MALKVKDTFLKNRAKEPVFLGFTDFLGECDTVAVMLVTFPPADWTIIGIKEYYNNKRNKRL